MFTLQMIAQVVAILVIAGWLAYKEISERTKQRSHGLLPNPERCRDHATAINSIRDDIVEIRSDISRIKDRLEIV